jgi:putative ABC transport system permease protein
MDRPGRWDTSGAVNGARVQTFKQLLKANPNIESVGMSDEIPGRGIRFLQDYQLAGNIKPVALKSIGIDEDFFHTLGMNMLAGRNFSKAYKTDYTTLILTKSAAAMFGFSNPGDAIGKHIQQGRDVYTVVGVADDFHQMSLATTASPIVFGYNGEDYEADEYYLVKLKTANVQQTIGYIKNTWTDVFKGNPFGFFFLDEFFNNQYKTDVQFGMLFGVFSCIAIVIACIGLFALTAFMIEQRRKEIGVRKVLGAGIYQVVKALTGDFIVLVLMSNIIAWPLGWLLMHNWFTDFAYRINISLWVFVLAGAAALLIALVAISWQAIKAAAANPVKSLRAE